MNAARNYINLQKRNKDGKLKDKYRQLRKKKPSGKGKKKKKKVKLTTFGKILFTLIILGIIFFLVWGTYKLLNKKNKTDNNTEVTEIVKNDISASVKDIKKEEKKLRKLIIETIKQKKKKERA